MPDSLPVLVDPVTGDPLSSSNGKSQTEYMKDSNDELEATAGRLLTLPWGVGTTSASESVINAVTTITGFVTVNPSTTPQLDTVIFSPLAGAAAVKSANLQVAYDNNPELTTKFYYNHTADVARGNYSWLAFDFRYKKGSGEAQPGDVLFEAFVSDVVDVGGSVVTARLPRVADQTWGTVYVSITSLTNVRCIGMRSVDVAVSFGTNIQLWMDNIRFASQTELEYSLEQRQGVIVQPSYVPSGTQRIVDIPSTRTYVDMRPGGVIANDGGYKYVRQFQLLDDTGATDVTAQLQTIFDLLQDNDTLLFNPRGLYKIDVGDIHIPTRQNLTIDGRGARFYTTLDRNSKWFILDGGSGTKILNMHGFGYKLDTILGSSLTDVVGSVVSGTTRLLDTQGDSCRALNMPYYARDHNGEVKAEFVLSDTAQVAQDCIIEFSNSDAPATAPGIATVGTDGPVWAGTRYYAYSFLDAEGNETTLSPTTSLTTTTGTKVDMTLGLAPVSATTRVPYIGRRIYRTSAGTTNEPRSFQWVDDILDNTTTAYRDMHVDSAQNIPLGPITFNILAATAAGLFTTTTTHNLLVGQRISISGMTPSGYNITSGTINTVPAGNQFTVTLPGGLGTATGFGSVTGFVTFAQGAAGLVEAGLHKYRVTFVYDSSKAFRETVTSLPVGSLNLTVPSHLLLSAIPVGGTGVAKVRIYRTVHDAVSGLSPNYRYVGEVANGVRTFDDNVPDASLGDVVPDNVSGRTAVVFARRAITLTASPTTYTLRWKPAEGLNSKITISVRKATATANTITVGSLNAYGRVAYAVGVENSHFLDFAAPATNVLVDGCSAEGVGGDFLHVSNNSLRGFTARNFLSRGCRRQGMSVTDGTDVTFEDGRIWETARTGLDCEPQAAESISHLTIRRLDIRNASNALISCNGWDQIDDLVVDDVRLYGAASQAFLGGATNGVFTDIDARYLLLAFTGINMRFGTIRYGALSAKVSEQPSDAGIVPKVAGGYTFLGLQGSTDNIDSPIDIRGPNASVMGASLNAKPLPVFPTNSLSPYKFVNDTVYFGADPGVFRLAFPNTYPGIAAGTEYHANGLDMLKVPLRSVRGISAGTVLRNNLNGVLSIAGGNTTGTIVFPVQLQLDGAVFPNPTSFALTATTGGGFANGTYYYRVAGRPRVGGPVLALGQQAIVVGGTNNAIAITPTGLQQGHTIIQALTVYRGTTSGVYNTRFDIVPSIDTTGDFPSIGQLTDLKDSLAPGGFGFPTSITPTTTTGHPSWTGSAWTPQDETGFELDTNYRLIFTPSWPTTVSLSAVRMNGADLQVGVAAPTGGGEIYWELRGLA